MTGASETIQGNTESAEKFNSEPLWPHVFDHVRTTVNMTILHELDVRRFKAAVTGLWAVGETPTSAELKNHLDAEWPSWPGARKTVRGLWRSMERNPFHQFRQVDRHTPLHTIDLVCERAKLRPPEYRLANVLELAGKQLSIAATSGYSTEFDFSRRTVEQCLENFKKLRFLRLGARAVGGWFDPDTPSTYEPKRPRWWGAVEQ